MKTILLCIACAVALSGCDMLPKAEAKGTNSELVRDMRGSAADQTGMRPGLWQSKVTIEKFDMPGMPPEMASSMMTMMAENQGHDFQTCLSPADVKRPKEAFFAGKENQCRYDQLSMAGGKIDATMHCGQGGNPQTVWVAGTYSSESYRLRMATELDASDEAQHAMQMQVRVVSQRVGECSPKPG